MGRFERSFIVSATLFAWAGVLSGVVSEVADAAPQATAGIAATAENPSQHDWEPVMWAPAAQPDTQNAKNKASTRPADKENTLSASQHARLVKDYYAFADAKPGSAWWFRMAEQVISYGPEGIKKVRPTIEARYSKLGREYQAAFGKAAKKVLADRLATLKKQGKSAKDVDEEIRGAREVIRKLRAKEDLEKADLVEKADPAMRKLAALMGIDAAKVFAADSSLVAKRTELLKVWSLKERCDGGKPQQIAPVAANMDAMMAMLAMPISVASRKTIEANFKSYRKLELEVASGIRDLNLMRLLAGEEALAIDLLLCKAGHDHAKDMAEKGFFSHESPIAGKKTPYMRARLAGTTASGENIAYGTSTGTGANRMWFHSPGHFKNMMNPGYKRVGLGTYERRWTQMFGR